MKTISRIIYFIFFVFVVTFTSGCKTDEPSTDGIMGTVTDIDGNIYKTIIIGSQTWMIENLRTSRYLNGDLINRDYVGDTIIITNKSNISKRDTINISYNGGTILLKSKDKNYKFKNDSLFAKGDTIVVSYNVDEIYLKNRVETISIIRHSYLLNATNDSTWTNLKLGAHCTYNKTANEDSIKKFGRLYNYYAIIDSRKISPEGWHIPSSTEWINLQNYVSANFSQSNSYSKAYAATTNWIASTQPNAIGNDFSKNNSSGFSALPAGFRNCYGLFEGEGTNSAWWSCSNGPYFGSSWYMGLFYYHNDVIWSVLKNENGLSVRCIKD